MPFPRAYVWTFTGSLVQQNEPSDWLFAGGQFHRTLVAISLIVRAADGRQHTVTEFWTFVFFNRNCDRVVLHFLALALMSSANRNGGGTVRLLQVTSAVVSHTVRTANLTFS